MADLIADVRMKIAPLETEKATEAEKATPLAPWSRYCARMLDMTIYTQICWFLLFFLYPETAKQLNDHASIYTFIMPACGLLVDASVYGSTGWSLGKWIFGLKVIRKDGQLVAFKNIIRRNLSIWISGFGLGLPIISWITLISSYNTAARGEEAAWDRKAETSIEMTPIPTLRRGLGMAFTGTIALAVFVSAVYFKTEDRIAASQTLERQIASTAASLQTDLPKRLDSVTVMTAVTSAGRTLTYHYKLNNLPPQVTTFGLVKEVQKNATKNTCGASIDLINKGMIFSYRYTDENGQNAGFDVKASDCQ